VSARTSFLTATLAAVVLAAPAFAVEKKPARSDKPPAAAAKPQPQPEPQTAPAEAPPYEGQLMRLSEIMGALAYLRDLCADGDGAEYRARMAALLDAEAATNQERREKLAGAFNRGYRGYETTYRSCTPNARTVIIRFVDEGGRLAREISYRFGGA
jgi:uncharacterized protein (TIGR02301 family)